VQNFIIEVLDAVQNITRAVKDDFYFSKVQIDFTDIDIPDPQATLRIALNYINIYALLDAKSYAGATYTRTLYHSNTKFGLSKGSPPKVQVLGGSQGRDSAHSIPVPSAENLNR